MSHVLRCSNRGLVIAHHNEIHDMIIHTLPELEIFHQSDPGLIEIISTDMLEGIIVLKPIYNSLTKYK